MCVSIGLRGITARYAAVDTVMGVKGCRRHNADRRRCRASPPPGTDAAACARPHKAAARCGVAHVVKASVSTSSHPAVIGPIPGTLRNRSAAACHSPAWSSNVVSSVSRAAISASHQAISALRTLPHAGDHRGAVTQCLRSVTFLDERADQGLPLEQALPQLLIDRRGRCPWRTGAPGRD